MKKLFKITLTALLTAISVSAVADTYYLRYGRQDNPSLTQDFAWSDAASSSTNEYSWTITTLSNWDLYIWFSSTNASDLSGLYDLSTYTLNDPSGLQTQNNQRNYNSKHGVYMHLNNVSQLTITWNRSTNVITLGNAVASYTVSTTCEHGTFDPSSAKVTEGGSAVFTFTPAAGYSYTSHSVSAGTATVTRNGNTFTVAPTSNCTLTVVCSKKSYTVSTSLTEGSIDPTSATVNHGESETFEVAIPDGKKIDKTATNYSGSAEISYEGDEITLNNVQSAGTLTVAFSSTADETPVVYWEQYPTIGINAVNMHGYLAERYCNTVTEAGFYWKETNDITASDIESAVEGEHKFAADDNPAENGNSFHKTGADFSTLLNEPTTIYLVNYVTTSGGTGISDVVALVYKPCFPISSVTLNSDNVKLPQDYKYTFEATARSAGKTPVYKWYLDDALIEGAASNTYEFTMPDTNPHTIKVEVTGDCEVSEEATADITSCTIPEIALTATPASTTPWAMVEIAADGAEGHIGTGLWSVTPDAELKNGNYKGVEFRAGTPGNYTIKYVGISEECNSGVQVEAEIEITVNADSEDCVNP